MFLTLDKIFLFFIFVFSSEKQDEMHYMDLQARSNETESNYAQLQAEYEEIEQRNPQYANI